MLERSISCSFLIKFPPSYLTFLSLLSFQMFLNQEHRLMLAFAPDYDHLPLIAKVEVFEHALLNTEGDDLAKVH